MRRLGFLSAHWHLAVVLLLAVGVFCFWGYGYPYLVTERELMQLFLWNGDYLMQRLVVPGGMARYIGEWLVQFFIYIKYGALIYALMAAAIGWLVWTLARQAWQLAGHEKGKAPVWLFVLSLLPVLWFCRQAMDMSVPMTPFVALLMVLALLVLMPGRPGRSLVCTAVALPVAYWLAGPVALLLALWHLRWLLPTGARWSAFGWSAALGLLYVACLVVSSRLTPYPLKELAQGVDYRWDSNRTGEYEDMAYYTLLRRRQWEGIVDKSGHEPPQSLASQNVVRLAMWYTRRIGQDELRQCLHHSRTVMTSAVSTGMMSDVYLHLGIVNMSQRAAFEAMESIPNGNKSGRMMKRLAETALYTGQYAVALKYISLLEQTLFYRDWARQTRPLAENPDLLHGQPKYHDYEVQYAHTEDIFFY